MKGTVMLVIALTFKVEVHCYKTLSPWDYPLSFGFLQYLRRVAGKLKWQTPLHCLFSIQSTFWRSWSSRKKSLQASWVRLTLALYANLLLSLLFCQIIHTNVKDGLSTSCYGTLRRKKIRQNGLQNGVIWRMRRESVPVCLCCAYTQ